MSNKARRRPRDPRERIQRRLRRTSTPANGWELEHSPYTFEGRIEGLGRFADGVNRGHRRREVRGMYWLWMATPVACLIVWLAVTLLNR